MRFVMTSGQRTQPPPVTTDAEGDLLFGPTIEEVNRRFRQAAVQDREAGVHPVPDPLPQGAAPAPESLAEENPKTDTCKSANDLVESQHGDQTTIL